MAEPDDDDVLSDEGPIHRTVLRWPVALKEKAAFWAEHRGSQLGSKVSINDFLIDAVTNEIARCAGAQIDADHILTARMNQLTDAVLSLESQVDAINRMVTSSFSDLIELARGDNMLTDAPLHDDGELDGV